jgi:hypothetical protein
MAVVKYIVLASVALSLAACQTTQPPATAIVQVEKPAIMVPAVDNIKIQDAEWYVVKKTTSPDQAGSAEKAFRESNSDSLLAVTPDGYESLATNQANLVKIIRQYQAQVAAYKDYYIKSTTDGGTNTTTKDSKDGKSK